MPSKYTEEERRERKKISQKKYREKMKRLAKEVYQDTDRCKTIKHNWYIKKKENETPEERERRLEYQREYRNKIKNKNQTIHTHTETRKRYDPDEKCPTDRKEASKWRKRRDYHMKKMKKNTIENTIENTNDTIENTNDTIENTSDNNDDEFGVYSINNDLPQIVIDDALFVC